MKQFFFCFFLICFAADILQAQFVGIGTTTPANKLSVVGNADFSGNVGIGTTTTSFLSKFTVAGNADFSGNVAIGTTPSTLAKLLVNGDAAFFGNIGVGTITPSVKLDVTGTIRGSNLIITTGAAANSVMVSDASGNATWETLSAAGIVSGSGNTSNVAFWNGTSSLSSNNNLFWDNTAGSLGIGTSTPAASAQLDVSSTTKGFLLPRMNNAQRNAITGPVAGLVVWCSNCGGFGELNVYNGTSWTNMIGGATSAAWPSVTTTAISNIASNTAVSGGNVLTDGGSPVTARGVCWDIAANPTIALSTKTSNGTGTGSFVSNITGLTFGQTYHVRAYATSVLGTSYGADVSFTTTYGIGDNVFGGIVAYLLQPGDPGYDPNVPHGLIAAASDQSAGIQWYNGTFISTGATATAIGTGSANTNTIVAAQGAGSYAAKLCLDLVLNTYSDWYLPSKDELQKLYVNRVAIGGFTAVSDYWSSSDFNLNNTWTYTFFNGAANIVSKSSTVVRVRAIRSF